MLANRFIPRPNDAHFDSIGVFAIRFLANLLNHSNQVPSLALSDQRVGQLGRQDDHAAATAGGCPAFFGLQADLDVFVIEFKLGVADRNLNCAGFVQFIQQLRTVGFVEHFLHGGHVLPQAGS